MKGSVCVYVVALWGLKTCPGCPGASWDYLPPLQPWLSNTSRLKFLKSNILQQESHIYTPSFSFNMTASPLETSSALYSLYQVSSNIIRLMPERIQCYFQNKTLDVKMCCKLSCISCFCQHCVFMMKAQNVVDGNYSYLTFTFWCDRIR